MRIDRYAFWILLAALGAAAALAPASAAAVELELTPIVGYSSTDYEFSQGLTCLAIFADCTLRGETDDGAAFGLILGVELRPRWQLELLANRQESDLDARGRLVSLNPGIPDVVFTEAVDFEVTHLQIGASRTFGEGTLRPFVGAAVGVSRVEVDPGDRQVTAGSSEDALSASAGGGVKVDLSDRLGLRLEGRAWWVDLGEEAGGDVTQLDAAAGLVVRF